MNIGTEVFAENGPRNTLVKSAVMAGQPLTSPQIQQVNAALGILPPSVGSGANGNLLKKDHAAALVKKVCEDLDEAEQQRLISLLAPETSKKKTDDDKLVEVVSFLDPAELEHFKTLVTDCMQELEQARQEEMEKMKPSERKKRKAEDGKDNNEKKKDQKKEQPGSSTDKNVDKKPDDEPHEVNPDLQKAMKPAARIEGDGPRPAQHRAQPVDPQPKARGKTRKTTPDCLKDLLPNIDALYIAWMPDNRMVQADFQGQG
jgi:hypothetical protein